MVNKPIVPLCIITSNKALITEADQLNIDRIMIDLERMGKRERQKSKYLFISNHRESDIQSVKSILTHSKLMVRINPIHTYTKDEINRVIEAGADIIMLPYFFTSNEVKIFIDYISGRCKTSLLVETKGAIKHIDDITAISGIDEIYIGLNDLQLSLNTHQLFDVLFDGTLERAAATIKSKNILFGFGGVAPPSFPMPIEPEAVIAEQIRFQSQLAILSRRVTQQLEQTKHFKQLSEMIFQIEKVAAKWLSASPLDFAKNRLNFNINWP